MSRREFVIDAQVLYEAENPESEFFQLALAFLSYLVQHTGHCIAVDQEGNILAEYGRMFRQSRMRIVHTLYLHLERHRRIQWYCGQVPNAVESMLRAIDFDETDLPFVGTSSRTTDRLLVAEESDYSSEVKNLIRRELQIETLSIAQASGRL